MQQAFFFQLNFQKKLLNTLVSLEKLAVKFKVLLIIPSCNAYKASGLKIFKITLSALERLQIISDVEEKLGLLTLYSPTTSLESSLSNS